MATIIESPAVAAREEKFFFVMACVMAATLVAGFGLNAAIGRSSFGAPLVYHVHAAIFFGWVVLYLTQNALIFTGSVAIHRRLGWLAVIWVPMMVAMGTLMTVVSLRRGGPPFFDQNEFLFGNPTQVIGFAVLAYAAVAARKHTGWHRRLMFCGMALLTGPGLGRLLPMPFLIPWAWWGVFAVTLIFPAIGMIADKRRLGYVHRAWFWGLGVMFAGMIIGDLLAYSSFGISFTHDLLQGTPGALRSMKAFFPS